jgi:hypothetical protein
MTSPTIIQTPAGPIIEGNKVTLTCTIGKIVFVVGKDNDNIASSIQIGY